MTSIVLSLRWHVCPQHKYRLIAESTILDVGIHALINNGMNLALLLQNFSAITTPAVTSFEFSRELVAAGDQSLVMVCPMM